MSTLHSYEQLGRQVKAVMELVRHFQKELNDLQRTSRLKEWFGTFGNNFIHFLARRRLLSLSYLTRLQEVTVLESDNVLAEVAFVLL